VEFRTKLGLSSECVKVYGNYVSLLEDPNVDVVYIGNLNRAHYEWIMRSLEFGKHVLCEKPLAVNAKQAREVCRKSKDAGLFLMEGFWSRFFPSWRELHRIIIEESSELGKPLFSEAKFCINLPSGRRDMRQGECPLNDVGLYTIMFSTFVFRDQHVSKVSASGRRDENGCDLWANITLEFEGGGHAICYYNSTTSNSSSSASVTFERGQVEFPETFWCATKLGKKTTQIPLHRNTSSDSHSQFMPFPLREEETATKFNFHNSSGLCYEIDHVFECIRQGKKQSEIMSLDESIKIIEILDEIRRQLDVVFPADDDI